MSQEGFEPSTKGLRVPCSTAELLAHGIFAHISLRIRSKELLRRAALIATIATGEAKVADAHLRQAMEELAGGGELAQRIERSGLANCSGTT